MTNRLIRDLDPTLHARLTARAAGASPLAGGGSRLLLAGRPAPTPPATSETLIGLARR